MKELLRQYIRKQVKFLFEDLTSDAKAETEKVTADIEDNNKEIENNKKEVVANSQTGKNVKTSIANPGVVDPKEKQAKVTYFKARQTNIDAAGKALKEKGEALKQKAEDLNVKKAGVAIATTKGITPSAITGGI